MAHNVTLFSRDEPFLKIGEPVTEVMADGFTHTTSPAMFVFVNGFADVDWGDPEIQRMVLYTQRTYPIEILDDPDMARPGDPDAVECPVCGYLAKSPFGLKAHLRSHKPA